MKNLTVTKASYFINSSHRRQNTTNWCILKNKMAIGWNISMYASCKAKE